MPEEMDLLQVQLLFLKCKDKISQIAILNIMISFQQISKLPIPLLRQLDKLPLMFKKNLTQGEQDSLLPQHEILFIQQIVKFSVLDNFILSNLVEVWCVL